MNSSSSEDKGKWYQKYLTEGIIISTLLIVTYTLLFAYNYGYGKFYDIPLTLVSFSMPTIFTTAVLLIPLFILFIAQLGTIIEPGKALTKGRSIVWQNFSITAFIVLGLNLMDAVNELYHLALAILAYLLVRHLLAPILWHRDKKGYWSKIDAHYKAASAKTETLLDRIFNFALYRDSSYVLITVGLIAITMAYGHYVARNQTSHFILKDSDYAVAKFLDDKVVLVNILPNNKVGNEIIIKPLSDENNVWILKETGKYLK